MLVWKVDNMPDLSAEESLPDLEGTHCDLAGQIISEILQVSQKKPSVSIKMLIR